MTQVLCTLNDQNNDVENVGVGLINVKSFKPLKFTIMLLTLPFHEGPEYHDAFTMLRDFSEFIDHCGFHNTIKHFFQ